MGEFEDEELTYTGPGDDAVGDVGDPFERDDRFDDRLAGGMRPEIAAAGVGGAGALVLGITGWLKRRRTRARIAAEERAH